MTITAALPWYDEPIDLLVTCVRALRGIADRIVALDGAYRRYPGGRPHSPEGQVRALRETAEELGIECLVLQPDRLWAGQVEKRTFLVNAASVDSDWLLRIDADHIVQGDGASIHHLLESVREHTIDVPYYYPPDPAGRPMAQAAALRWTEGLAGTTEMTPHLFRALPGMRYERFHWYVSGLLNGQRIWMDGDPGDRSYPFPRHLEGIGNYSVEHRCLARTRKKIRGNRAFCNDRVMVVERTGQEDHVEGLPEPEWEYEERLV